MCLCVLVSEVLVIHRLLLVDHGLQQCSSKRRILPLSQH
jgi:hypothetical protein